MVDTESQCICIILHSYFARQLVAMQFEPSNRMEQTKQLLTRLQDAMQPSDMSTCGGFVTTYGFLADFFSCPFRDEVSWVMSLLHHHHIVYRVFPLLGY